MDQAVELLYAAIHKAEHKVGGGEGLVGIYGTMTKTGTHSILQAMEGKAELNSSSVLVDIGSGLCRPLLHAIVGFGVRRTFGVELDAVKCQKAVPFVQHVRNMCSGEGLELSPTALPKVICSSAQQLESLEPATHAYSAWEGFPTEAKLAVGRLFASSQTLRTIAIVQRSMRNKDPAAEMEELGFGQVHCVTESLPVHMAGSGRQLCAYIFCKSGQPRAAAGSRQAKRPKLSLETAPTFHPAQVVSTLHRQASEELSCKHTHSSSSSSSSIALAVGPHTAVHQHGLRRRKPCESDSQRANDASQLPAAAALPPLSKRRRGQVRENEPGGIGDAGVAMGTRPRTRSCRGRELA
ncbi:hypothetical protein QJQ45_027054 [Haematococcus lacustris]|nr:hypothetical protein QJQ45_027054 [Haematococcus lacustris]